MLQTGPNPDVNPEDPEPPSTPDACDPKLEFDAVTNLRKDILFFKGR